MLETSFTFYDRPGYFKQLIAEISRTKKGDRVALASMPIDTREPLVLDIVEALRVAAQRGVEVLLCIDAYTFLMEDKPDSGPFSPFKLGPLWSSSRIRTDRLTGSFKGYYEHLESIAKAGGTYCITNIPPHPFSNPKAGRSHIKLAVINNTAYIGGNNLKNLSELDIMAALENKKLADYLFVLTQNIAKKGTVRTALADTDQHVQIGSNLDLFVDAGVPKQSRILDEALAFIDASNTWLYFTCQYFPGGIVGQHLARAVQRGVDVKVVFSHPNAHSLERYGHQAYNHLQKLQLPDSLFAYRLPKGSPNLHAKLLANQQGAILGSHNYVTQGVSFGTAEVALRVGDPDFSQQAVRAIAKLLPSQYGPPEKSLDTQ